MVALDEPALEIATLLIDGPDFNMPINGNAHMPLTCGGAKEFTFREGQFCELERL